nr:NTF2-related export protein 2 isoform X3 [Caretta caretta]
MWIRLVELLKSLSTFTMIRWIKEEGSVLESILLYAVMSCQKLKNRFLHSLRVFSDTEGPTAEVPPKTHRIEGQSSTDVESGKGCFPKVGMGFWKKYNGEISTATQRPTGANGQGFTLL